MATWRGIGSLVIGLTLVACGGPRSDDGPKLTLTWSASAQSDEYVVERAEAGSFREIARVPASRTQYVDRAVQLGTEYCYQVRARNHHGVSPPSPSHCGTPRP